MERVATSLEESGSIRPVLDHFNSDGSMTEEPIEQPGRDIMLTCHTKHLGERAGSPVRGWPLNFS